VKTQAILPLRGKVLNAEQATSPRSERTASSRTSSTALGCGMGKTST
jgi:DNA gyrase/topoisomerase IV subunit B